MSINVCIFGVSGYTGSKLLYFLDRHKKVKVHGVFGEASYGKKLGDIHKNLYKNSKLLISDYKEFDFGSTDLIFSCLPHSKFQKEIIKNINPKIPIIDLSADFRLDSLEDYEEFYECKHNSRELQNKFVYGLSEVNRNKIRNSKFISNPGCYPTSILIPIIPLIKEKKFGIKEVLVDSKSGISGAGKKAKIENLFTEISENFFAYGVSKHQHYPEINQEMNKINEGVSLTFIPHVVPIISGIQSTIYLDLNADKKEYEKVLFETYENENFIKIFKDSDNPSIKDVRNTNNLVMKVFSDYSKKKIILVSCIDNLIKGASGQAIQNMNIMFGFDESESLI